MARAWLVRTGEGGAALGACIAEGVAALRYDTVGDARSLTDAEIEAGIAAGGLRVDLAQVRAMLREFESVVLTDDVIVTPHLKERRVFFGRVAGDYEYRKPSPVAGFLHLRPVTWVGDVPRDSLPASRLQQIDRPPTLYSLPDQDWWLQQYDDVRKSGRPLRPPRRDVARARSSVAKGPAAGAVRTLLCSECGLLKPAHSVQQGVCSDCRL